ncbi:MAG TPA: vitamin K epoxide reductase family protein [Nocardioidaceae bacterium]
MATQTRVRGTDAPQPVREERRPAALWFVLMLGGGVVGAVAAGWQLVERIAYAEGAGTGLCEINSVLSCTSIFAHWQSSALGVPNTLVSLPIFALLASGGLAGLLGTRLSRAYAATLFGLTVFMSLFVTWYMHQSAFAIGALCLFCTVGAAALITIGVGVTRVVDAEQALGSGRAGRQLRLLVEARADLIVWAGLAALIAVLLYLGLAL